MIRKRTRIQRIPHLPKMYKGLWNLHKDNNVANRIRIIWDATKIVMK